MMRITIRPKKFRMIHGILCRELSPAEQAALEAAFSDMVAEGAVLSPAARNTISRISFPMPEAIQ